VEALETAGGHLSAPLRLHEPSDAERAKSAHAAFEPLTVLVALYTLVLLAERIARMVGDQKYGGMIIDIRTTPATVREEQALDRGTVYLIKQDGVTSITRPGSPELLEALKSVLH
jgi:hypothetical protein